MIDAGVPSTVGDNGSYFYCKRGRKYRNSVRPNRVTGSRFWKATGIDKPVYNSHGSGEGHHCIGLKKTLVYYRGSAGKGTKTDWMMHEFRLPAANDNNLNLANTKTTAQEAEVWTLCRIFKRNISSRKYTPDWRELATKRVCHSVIETNSKACSVESNNRLEAYINFGAPIIHHNNEEKPKAYINHMMNEKNIMHVNKLSSISQLPSVESSSSFSNPDGSEFFTNGNWD